MANDIFGIPDSARPILMPGYRYKGTHVMTFEHELLDSLVLQSSILLVQDVTAKYLQQVTTVKGLNSLAWFRIANAPQGQGSLGLIVGPGGDLCGFAKRYGDPCVVSNVLTFSGMIAECTTGNNDIGTLPQQKLTGVILSEITETSSISNLQMAVNTSFEYISHECIDN